MKKSTYCMEIGQGVKSLRGSDRGFDCRLTVVRPSADRRFRAVKVLTVLLLILTIGVGNVFGDELTVADGTLTNSNVPVWGNWCDADTRTQLIYPASLLTSMQNKNITSMTFYVASKAAAAWTSTFTIGLAEVEESSIAGDGGYWGSYYFNSASTTTVYSGSLDGTGSTMVVSFSTPFYYEGGNLLFNLTSLAGNYKDATFYGANQSATANIASHGSTTATSSSTGSSFLPKTTFTYVAAAPITCPKPTDLSYSNLSATSVDLDWTAGGSETNWNVLYKESGDADWSSVGVSENSYTLSGLIPNSSYQVKVQAVCGVGDESSFSNVVSFSTPCASITLPWALDLSSATNDTILECWDISGSTSTTKSGSSSYNIWGVYSAGGTKMLRMNNYSVQAGTALINTPNIVVPNDGKNYELAFDYENSAYKSTTNLSFSVKVSKDGGSTFSELDTYAKNSSVAYDGTPADFEEATISLADYAGETIILQFFANANYGYGAMFVKNIRIIAATSCTKPSALNYSNVTTNSAELAWTAGGSETAWNVRYKADGDADWTVVPANANPFTLSGLSDNTHYTAQVQADCGGEQSEWNSTAVSFTTLCNPFALPFAETFDGLTAGIPDCWDNSEGTTDNDAYKWNYYATGYSGKCVRFEALYNPTDRDNYLKTPSITVSEAAILSFRYKNPKGAALSVYYSIDGGEKAALISSLTTKTAWSDLVEQELPPAWVGHNVVIMFRGVSNCSYNDAYIYLDEVQVKAKPSCAKPTDLGYSAETSEGATLSWTVGGSETAWTIEYSTVADFSSDAHEVAAGTNPFVLTGLNEQTTYYVRVKAECGPESESEYSEAVSFTTKCAAITSFPWTEDFEDETNETNVACWDNSASTCFSNPAGTTPSKYVWGVIRTGSYGDYKFQLYMRNFNVRSGTALVNTPSFTLPNDKDMQLVFNYSHLASCDPLVVKISVNGGAFSAIDGASYANDPAGTYSYSNPGTYKEATINLSAYRGKTITLQFFTTANYGDGAIWLDNVKIEQAPSCFKPATLNAATDITPNGATFSWTASASNNEDYYQYICVPTGETPDWATSTKVAKAVENQAVISGLAAGPYDFYVRSWCAEEDQSEAVKGSFTTATIPAPASVSVTGITNNSASAEWTAPSVAYAVQYQYSLVESGDPLWSAATSDLSHLFENLEANTAYTLYVRTYFDATHTGAQASTSFTTMCDPIVVSSAAYEENFSSFPACWNNDEGTTTNNSYKWSSVSGGKEGYGMRFESRNNASGRTNVLASPLFTLNTDADLTFWMKNKKGGDYTVEISVNGATRTTLIGSMTNIADWTMQEVSLSEYIGQNIQLFFCGTSNWSESADGYLYLDELAITPITCRKPAADPTVDSKDATSATISWPAVTGATGYQFCLVEKDETPVWEDANIVSSPTKILSGLEASNSYDFYVRNYCDDSNQSEARKVSFRTGCGTITTLPWEENFESVTLEGKIPECWASVGDLESYSYEWKHANYIGKNSSKGMQCGLAVEIAGKTNILATPSIQLGEGDILSFWCKNIEGDNFVVEISSDGGVSKNQILDLTSVMTDWTLKYVNLTAYNNQEVILYFKATSPGDYNGDMIYIDNVRVARGEFFDDDAAGSGVESRIAGLENETLDFIMNRPMQFEGSYNTLCLPFDLSAEQLADADCPLYNNTVKVFDYARVAASELQLAITGASSIHAGVPCFVKYDGTAEAPRSIFLFKDVTIKTGLNPKADGEVEYRGIYNPIAVEAETDNGPHHIIFVGAENQLYWPGADRTMRGFRAYFYVGSEDLEGNPIRRGIPARLVEHTDSATGMDEITDQPSAFGTQKVLENDQVIILRNGVKYNMQGQVIR